jgi:hypothetical protein
MGGKQRPSVVALDPEKFYEAFNKAMEAAEGVDVVPIEIARTVIIDDKLSDEQIQVRFRNNPMIRMICSLKRSYPELEQGMSASMRVNALMNLAARNKLGGFQRNGADAGIHECVIKAAAQARWLWSHGGEFDFHDLQRRTMAFFNKWKKDPANATPSSEGEAPEDGR